MKNLIKQSINSGGGNIRASSSNVDNFRNNQNSIKKITNNIIPDTYHFRNNNYINIKFDKFNNINSNTNKHLDNKKYNYLIEPQSQSRSKQNINYDHFLNGIDNMNEEIRELSKSIEKTDEMRNKKELFNSFINININKDEDFPQGENSFRFSCLNNNTNNNIDNIDNIDISNTSNICELNNNIFNVVENDNKFNYKQYKKNNIQNKQRKSNNINNINNYSQNKNNIKVGIGKTVNLSLNKIKELNIRNDSLERTNLSLNKKLKDKENIITKLIRTINALKKNDNNKIKNIGNLNNESENKLNFLIQEFIDSKKILAQLKTKDDLIIKMGNKMNLMEEEINKLKYNNNNNNNKNIDEKFNTEKKSQKNENKERLELIEIKKGKSKLVKNNSFLTEDKKDNLFKENIELKNQLKIIGEENNKLTKLIKILDIKFKELENTNTSLEEYKNIHEKNNAFYIEENHKLKEENKIMKEKIINLNKNKEEFKKLKVHNEQLMSNNKTNQKRITNLNSQLTRKNSRIKELSDKIKILSETKNKNFDIKNKENKDNDINDEVNLIKKENNELKNNIINLNKEKNELNDLIEINNKKKDELLKDKDNVINNLQQEINKFRELKEQNELIIQEKNNEIDNLKKENDIYKQKEQEINNNKILLVQNLEKINELELKLSEITQEKEVLIQEKINLQKKNR